MQTLIHSFEQERWKFMVVADVNRRTGMCLLDVYATTYRPLTRDDLKKYTVDELLAALRDVEMRNHVTKAMRECKQGLVAEHTKELRFIHVLNQALHTIRAAVRCGGSQQKVEKRWAKARRRLFTALYKMDITCGFRFEMARKMIETRNANEIGQLFTHLDDSRRILTKQVRTKCDEAEYDTWQAMVSLAPGHFNQLALQKKVGVYSKEWINLRCFVVERTYLSKIHDFCDRFVDDKQYREGVIQNETVIFEPAGGQRRAG